MPINNKSNINELRFDSILPDLKVSSQKQVIQNLSDHVENLIGISSHDMASTLCSLEATKSAVIRNGVAIMDSKLPRLTKPLVIFTRCTKAVDFKASDHTPIDLVCLVLSPTHEVSGTHLRRLAKVSRFFNDQRFCDLLRYAESAIEVKSILAETNKLRLAA